MWRASPQYCQIVRYAGSLITLFTDLVRGKDGRKGIFSFKKIMTAIAAYLVLHTCISVSSNCQKFVSNSPIHVYCSLLPLDAISFVNVTTQNTACLLFIWWTPSCLDLCTVHLTNDCKVTHTAEFQITHSARRTGRDGVFSKPVLLSVFLSGANVGRVCASVQRGP